MGRCTLEEFGQKNRNPPVSPSTRAGVEVVGNKTFVPVFLLTFPFTQGGEGVREDRKRDNGPLSK